MYSAKIYNCMTLLPLYLVVNWPVFTIYCTVRQELLIIQLLLRNSIAADLRVEVFAGVLLAVTVSEDALDVRRTALRLPVNARRRRDRRHGAVVTAVSVQQAAVAAVDDEPGVDGVLDGQLLRRRDGAARLDDRRGRVRRRPATVAADHSDTTGRPLYHDSA